MDIIQDQSTRDTDDDWPEDTEPNGTGPEYTDFRLILNAPDFASFIKRTKNATVREYERRTASALKALALGAMQAEDFPDAATVLWFGPSVATATGYVADASPRARAMLDVITAPNSPWVALALAVMPMFAQLARNHEAQLAEVPARLNMSRKARAMRKVKKAEAEARKPTFTFRLGKFRRPVYLQFNPARLFSAGIKAQTVDPMVVTSRVFTDPTLLAELRRMGFNIKPVQHDG